MSKDKPRLGRGLASLVTGLAEPSEPDTPPGAPGVAGIVTRPVSLDLAPNAVKPNPFQPRTQLDPQALDELVASIREHGIVQPIVVRFHGDGYQLIAGQRRLEAARRAELKTIPAIVREASDQEMLEISLVENIQREDLNCVDRAAAYRQYQETFGFSSDKLAERLGQDRTTIVNYLRLLTLPDEVLQFLQVDRLSMGHARALAGLDNPSMQIRLAVKIVQQGLSVRQAEAMVARSKEPGGPGAVKKTEKSPNTLDLEQQMTRALSTRVQITPSRKKGTGKVVIEYYSLDDFERILDQICGQDREEL